MGWRQYDGARAFLRRGAAAFNRSFYTIQAVPRENTGSRLAARERALGRIPAVVITQGDGEVPESSRKLLITANKKQIITLLKRVPFFCSTTFQLQVRAGPGSSVLLQSGTVLPIKVHKREETGDVLNLVLAWAEKEASLKVDVPVVYKGEEECPALKKGGFLQKIRPSIRYLCPSEHIPPNVEVDLSRLDVSDRVLLRDVSVHPSLKLLSKNEAMPICKLTASKPDCQSEAGSAPGDEKSA
ncbi:ribosomal protein L25/Gln-tRNA synthetase, anti-codon-binding domain-containing protein [Wolffia australiana]